MNGFNNSYKTSEQMRNHIYSLISSISPFDDLEEKHIQDSLKWVRSNKPLFRLNKPDMPRKHLVVYFVLANKSYSQILLTDHLKARLWLPPGGHVEINEAPKDTVKRECKEELNTIAQFWEETPFFITSTHTLGLTAKHIDVSLWYILKGDSEISYSFNQDEFSTIKWFNFRDIPYKKSDPHMQRFVNKFLKGIST